MLLAGDPGTCRDCGGSHVLLGQGLTDKRAKRFIGGSVRDGDSDRGLLGRLQVSVAGNGHASGGMVGAAAVVG